MIIQKSRGILLNHIRYGDSSIIATVFTESHGRKSFLIRGVYKHRSSFPASFFQPLTLVNLEMSLRTGHDLHYIRELGLEQAFTTIPFHPSKSAIALFLGEMLYKCIREEEHNQALFDFLFHSIHLLDLQDTPIGNFHLIFLIKLTRYLGFFPENNYSRVNDTFDAVNGKFQTHQIAQNERWEKDISLLMHQLISKSFENISDLTLNHQLRNLLLRKIIEYYHLHLSGIGEVKSQVILQTVFSDESY